jgi:hypothetical protein
MSFVSAVPEALASASGDLTGIGSAIRAASAAALGSTTQVAAAAQDEVSVAISGLFGSYAQDYQAVIGQATLFHEQFAQALSTGGGIYAAAESANAAPLQTPAAGVNTGTSPGTTPSTPSTTPSTPSGPAVRFLAEVQQDADTVLSYAPPTVRAPLERGVATTISYLDPFAVALQSAFPAAIS